ncbi:MAG TPA: glycosyltransferase family 39 protein [Candidatus Elarobacter sp.]|jgi:Gpi18-like mannosyltransferase
MSTESAARVRGPAVAGTRQLVTPLAVILALGLVARLLFLGSDGFHNDVGAFQAWTLTLRDNPPWNFYAKTGFADYPPGYFVVLWVLSKLYAPFGGADAGHGYLLLRAFVKFPAIAMDLVNAAVVYAIVRRYAAERIALIGAGLLALNPAAIYVSSYWGQVDSVSWGLVLIALWLVLRAGDEPEKLRSRLIWAWLAFGFSVLIKPQGATIGLLLLAYPFATSDAVVRRLRLAGTAAGVGASLALGAVVGLLFHPALDVFGWLFGRYAFGSGVYKFNTVNAFNLYAIRQPFWRPDDQPLSLFGIPLGSMSVWGVVLVVAATLLIVGRYLQRRDDRALLEGAMLCALAFFVLATRMHERYVYGAFLLAMPLVAFGRAGLWSSIVLTVTMYLNLSYSLFYQTVMEAKTAGVDATNLWPYVSHPAALANVILFFWLGYLYLGVAPEARAAAQPSPWDERLREVAASARRWFDPREGTVALTRQDWLLILGFSAVAFVIAIVNFGWPRERYFDEIYFARSAGEYLRGIPQFEWTHPPLTKLVIAASMMLFGGIPRGDVPEGWRFLNVLIGALEVGVVYAFAKRLTASTVYAALAALCIAFDGFHFVESRISTGEITIATLIAILLYAFYRYWLAAQVRVEPRLARPLGIPFWATLALGIPVAVGFAMLANLQPANHTTEIANGIGATDGPTQTSYVIAFLYAYIGVYLLARLVVQRRGGPVAGTTTSYAEGTVVLAGERGAPVVQQPPDEPFSDGPAIDYARDGTMRYKTPEAAAEFTPDGVIRVDGRPEIRASGARTWLTVMLVALGLLLAAKWNGLYDLGLLWLVIGFVVVQRFSGRRALYGNPRGFPLDIVVGLMLFVSATIYALSYIPTLVLGNGHTLADLIALQQQMFWYHSHGVEHATHPYSSAWWQWPIMEIPIVYWYKDFRTGLAASSGAACCVAEIMAVPNPLVFLLGLVSVPYVAWLAWKERNKGYALLATAYFVQWLPWARTPRLLFEYHFFPNLVLIVLCDVILIQRLVARAAPETRRWWLGGYAVAVVLLFAYFYPVLAGVSLSYDQWHSRMWPDMLGIPGVSWILPHPGR